MIRAEIPTMEPIDTSLSAQPNAENRQPLTPVTKSEGKFQRLQKAWSENYAPVTEPIKHDRVSVLLLSWEKEGADMDVSEELQQLEAGLKNDYHFSVERKELAATSNPQPTLNSYIASFVEQNKDPHNLCILYYAGHGWGDGGPGRLYLTNNSSQDSRAGKSRKHNMVEWHQVEPLIEATEADALVIFDCCHAGSLQTFRSENTRKYEIFAACKYDEFTPGPGSTSFTSALIWALDQLKNSPGFDTRELELKVREAPQFGSDNKQTPMLWHKLRDNGEHIWISPQPAPGEITPPLSPTRPLPQYRQDRPMESLDVSIHFVKRLDEKLVGSFASAFSEFSRNEGSHLGIRRVHLNFYEPLFRNVGYQLMRQKLGLNLRPDQSLPSETPVKSPSTTVSVAKINPNESVEKKDIFLPRGWVFITIKAFVSGILLTLLFWWLFFYGPFQRLMKLWSRGDGWMISASGIWLLDREFIPIATSVGPPHPQAPPGPLRTA